MTITILLLDKKNKEKVIAPHGSPKATEVSQAPQEDFREEEVFVNEAIKQALEEAKLPADHPVTAEQRERILTKARARAMEPTGDELKIMFETPVEFYGRLLDQFDQPVIGADIRCSWPFMGPQDSARKLKSSAPDGQFQILGLKAISINVSVYPPTGYEETVRDSKEIRISKTPERLMRKFDLQNATPEQLESLHPLWGRPEAYKGDMAKPVIFRLKKL